MLGRLELTLSKSMRVLLGSCLALFTNCVVIADDENNPFLSSNSNEVSINKTNPFGEVVNLKKIGESTELLLESSKEDQLGDDNIPELEQKNSPVKDAANLDDMFKQLDNSKTMAELENMSESLKRLEEQRKRTEEARASLEEQRKRTEEARASLEEQRKRNEHAGKELEQARESLRGSEIGLEIIKSGSLPDSD